MTQTMTSDTNDPGDLQREVPTGLSPAPVSVLAEMAIDTDKMMLEGIDTSKKPLFSVSEMASFFFARSPHWVRWLEGEDRMVLDGVPLTSIRTRANARKYDLALIEKIAHALASNGTIDGTQLRRALLLVKIQAVMNNYLKENDGPADAGPDDIDQPKV